MSRLYTNPPPSESTDAAVDGSNTKQRQHTPICCEAVSRANVIFGSKGTGVSGIEVIRFCAFKVTRSLTSPHRCSGRDAAIVFRSCVRRDLPSVPSRA